jgi:hypothetical protein
MFSQPCPRTINLNWLTHKVMSKLSSGPPLENCLPHLEKNTCGDRGHQYIIFVKEFHPYEENR